MVIIDDIKEDIDLLLENSGYASGPFITVDGHEITPTGPLDTIHETIDEAKSSQQQAIDLSKIFYQQNKANQKLIKEYLVTKLGSGREATKVVVSTLFQTGNIDDFIDHIILKFKKNSDYEVIPSLQRLNHLLCYVWSGFNKEQVRRIRRWSQDVVSKRNDLGKDIMDYNNLNDTMAKEIIFGILKQTNHILVKDVRKRIELGFNPEINEDEKIIKDEISKFGFPQDLSEALNKIDEKLTSSRDAFDFKGTMDLLRSFTERLYRSVLDQYGDEGKKIHEQDSEAVSKYFVKKGLVNEDFGKMIASQRHFISNTASHRLKSREEDARLSKNMVIEMSLYILRRLQNN